MASFKAKSRRGFTLIEVLVTVAIVAVVALIAAPSMKDFIQMQRLKSVSSELMTNLQYSRSEAVSRGQVVGVRFGSDSSMTCYVIATRLTGGCINSRAADTCDCTLGPGAACSSAATSALWAELKTVVVSKSLGVLAEPSDVSAVPMSFDPTSGGLMYTRCNRVGTPPSDYRVDAKRDVAAAGRLHTAVSPTGRPTVCSCGGTVAGYPACAAACP